MKYMNDYDLDRAERVARLNNWPNRAALVGVVSNLRGWTNLNSDGWAYWPKPCRAAASAMTEITGDGTNAADQRPDCTQAQARKVCRPIRAFLTRHGVPTDQVDAIMHDLDMLGK